jgi:vacuolar-type H+-ATPase subunit H
MAPGVGQRKRLASGIYYEEEDERSDSSLNGLSSLPSFSGAATPADLPAHGPERGEKAPIPAQRTVRGTASLPRPEKVDEAKVEKDRLIAEANLAADSAKEDARKRAAKKREEMLAAALAEVEKEKKAMIEKAKKEALSFKSKKASSVPKVASAVFSKVFSDLF